MERRTKTLIIAGYGYMGCMLGAALLAIKENREGRSAHVILAPRSHLVEMLETWLLNHEVPPFIYFVGIGLDQDHDSMKKLLQRLAKNHSQVIWLSTSALPLPCQKAYDRLITAITSDKKGEQIEDLVCEYCSPWGEDERTARNMLNASKPKHPQYAALHELYQLVGFVNRVMTVQPMHRENVLNGWINNLISRKNREGLSTEINCYLNLYSLYGHREIKGKSEKMRALRSSIRKVAPADDIRVMILGESGTGKESVATYIHLNSPRWNKILLSFNCASSNPGLLESTFLGYKKGTFTGAITDKKGIFEQAHHGTLFLDEIGDLPLESQGILLRILEEKRFLPLGGHTEVAVDVRLITATNKNLWEMVEQGTFRKDLLFRLQEFTIRTCSLAEVKEDIMEIADAIWRARKKEPLPHSEATALLSYPWPGNVRELSNFLKYADVMNEKNWTHLLTTYRQERGQKRDEEQAINTHSTISDPDRLDDVITLHCQRIVKKYDGNISKAASHLGIQRATLRKHLAPLHIITTDTPLNQEDS